MDDGEGFYPTGLIRLIAVLALVAVLVGAPVLLNRLRRIRETRRGFEVKLNTGEKPVPEKKDENHG